jgi:hypothetical protein
MSKFECNLAHLNVYLHHLQFNVQEIFQFSTDAGDSTEFHCKSSFQVPSN